MKVILAIQSFLKNISDVFATIARIILFSKFFPGIRNEKRDKDLVILGNGPSLVGSLKKHKDFLSDKDLMCVNHFPRTEFYEQLRPAYYMSIAPDLWLDDIDKQFVEQSNILFDEMAKKTTWKIQFFFPYEARKYKRWQKKLLTNKNINIIYINQIPSEGWKFFRHWVFRHNLGMPRPHNVMIPSIFTGLNLGYKKIYLIGADHSWLPEITVNEDNIALINQKHFYDIEDSKHQTLDKRGKGHRRLHEILHKFMLAFAGYFVLKEYAESLNAEIFNATPNSYIDAFDRIDLNKINTTDGQI